jgi:hypothetical protein
MVPESSGSVCFSYLMQMYGNSLTYANIFRKKFKKKRKNFQAVKITDKTRRNKAAFLSVNLATIRKESGQASQLPAFCFFSLYNKVGRARPRLPASDHRPRVPHPEGSDGCTWGTGTRVPPLQGCKGTPAQHPRAHGCICKEIRKNRANINDFRPKMGKNAMKWGFFDPPRGRKI